MNAFGSAGTAEYRQVPPEWPGESVEVCKITWPDGAVAAIMLERDGEVLDCRDRRTMQPNFQIWRRGNGQELIVNAIYTYIEATRIADAWVDSVVRDGPA